MARIFLVFLALIATAAVSLAGWWWFNRPVAVALSFDEPFPSVSFAPFRRGAGLFGRDESPLTRVYPTPAEIRSDLASLRGVARGVRTYTALEGMGLVPEIAGQYGLEVTQSAWLGTRLDTNEREVEALIALANAHPDTIKRVIVGNEVLLRNDLTPAQLIGYIRRVKAAVRQPVSYADVWAFWLKHPELGREVDYITIHILPYWEDEPVGVEDAARHIVDVYRMVQKTFPGKPILIGEAGWPTRGRERGPAIADRATAALFIRTLARLAHENGFDYNVVEAFDQPWKANLEGTVGANWGVLDAHRRVKFGMSGPVRENPDWPGQAAASVLLGLAAALWAARHPLGRGASVWRILGLAALAQGLAAAVVWQAINAWWLGFDRLSDAWAYFRIALHAGFAGVLFAAAAKALAGGNGASRWGERLLPLYALAAIADTMMLLFHGRYRDIPNLEFLVPCAGVAAYGLLRMAILRLDWIRAFAVGRMFADDTGAGAGGYGPAQAVTWGLWLSVLASPLSDTVALAQGDDFVAMHPTLGERLPLLAASLLANRELLVWSLMLLVMSLPFLAEWRRRKERG